MKDLRVLKNFLILIPAKKCSKNKRKRNKISKIIKTFVADSGKVKQS